MTPERLTEIEFNAKAAKAHGASHVYVLTDSVLELIDAIRKYHAGLLEDAWDDGHRTALKHPVSGHWNPYRGTS